MKLKNALWMAADILLPKQVGIKDETEYLKPPRMKRWGWRALQTLPVIAGFLLAAGMKSARGRKTDLNGRFK